MQLRFFATCAALLALLLSGCASRLQEMPLSGERDEIKPDSPAIFIATINLKNSRTPSFPLMLSTIQIDKSSGTGKDDYFLFLMDEKGSRETESAEVGNTFFIRMALPKGSYDLAAVMGYNGFIPMRAIFLAPIYTNFDSPGSGVYYLGHITATLRERKDDEFRAGPLFPLNSPVAPSIFASTFDVEVVDRFQEDLPEFLKRFPGLKSAEIGKILLPPWDRAKAQSKPHY